jgi:hypothetical protein
MKRFDLGIAFCISSLLAQAQEDSLNIIAIEASTCNGYRLLFDRHPNEFLENNIRKYFETDEIEKLKELNSIGINILVSTKNNNLIKFYPYEAAFKNEAVIRKLIKILSENIVVEPRRIFPTAENCDYIARTVIITFYDY